MLVVSDVEWCGERAAWSVYEVVAQACLLAAGRESGAPLGLSGARLLLLMPCACVCDSDCTNNKARERLQ